VALMLFGIVGEPTQLCEGRHLCRALISPPDGATPPPLGGSASC
jgi:hypothetical protein